MALQKIKIITAEHPDILEVRVNEWLETMQEVNKNFDIKNIETTTLQLYNQDFLTCCIRYEFLEAKQ